MEPYRAYVSDRLSDEQRGFGFLLQCAFTGLGQMLAYLSPTFMVNALGFDINAVDFHNIPVIIRAAFTIGAVLSLTTILWSIIPVPELPLTEAERDRIKALKLTVGGTLMEIRNAALAMPVVMRKLALMSLFQWYAMFAYWNYVVYSISRSVYGETNAVSEGFRRAVLDNGQIGGFYNGVAFVAALAMVPLARRVGPALTHSVCLVAAGVGMFAIPHITDKAWLFLPAIGVGLGWASIMGNPHIILARSIPPERTGVYIGIFNMMIVIPMLLNAVTMPLYSNSLLGGDPRNALMRNDEAYVADLQRRDEGRWLHRPVMPWRTVQAAGVAAAPDQAAGAALSAIGRLGRAARSLDALGVSGRAEPIALEPAQVLGFSRLGGRPFLCLANFGDGPATVTRPPAFDRP